MELPTGLFNMPLVVELFKCFFPLKLHREVTDNNQCFIMYWRHMSVFQSIAHGPTIQFMECLLRIQIPRPHSSSSTSQLRWAFRVSVPQTPQDIAHWQLRTTRMGSRENMFDGCLFVGAELSHAHWDRRLCLCFCTSQCSHTNSPFTSNYKVQAVGWPLSSSVMTLTCWIIFGSWQSVTVRLACRSRCLPESPLVISDDCTCW